MRLMRPVEIDRSHPLGGCRCRVRATGQTGVVDYVCVIEGTEWIVLAGTDEEFPAFLLEELEVENE